MKKLKRICLITTLIMMSIMAFSGCSKKNAKIALLVTNTEQAKEDRSIKNTWEGIEEFCDENSTACKLIETTSTSEEAIRKAITKAVDDGIKTIICQGEIYKKAVLMAQDQYKYIRFVLIDAIPGNGKTGDEFESYIQENCFSMMFANEQSGFMTGYALVIEGYLNIGFIGEGANAPIGAYGFGLLQGAEYAAKELNLGESSVCVQYTYGTQWDNATTLQEKARIFYQEGCDVIFAAGGMACEATIAVADSLNKKVVASDSDYSDASKNVIFSAIKDTKTAIYNLLKVNQEKNYMGGRVEYFGVVDDSVSLTTQTAQFFVFDKSKYQALYNELKADTNGMRTGIKTAKVPINELKLSRVTIKQSGIIEQDLGN